MGSVLTPMYVGIENAGDLPNAATFCGQCQVACSVMIPLPDLMRKWRERQFDHALRPWYERVAIRAAQWPQIAARAGLPYHPAVSPGWDASPRGADFGPERPRKYPWWPIVTGEHPDRFRAAVERAVAYVRASGQPPDEQLVFVSSLNEWSEGHYLEPDTRFGLGWIEAVRDGRR